MQQSWGGVGGELFCPGWLHLPECILTGSYKLLLLLTLWSLRQVWDQNDIGDFKAVVSTKRQRYENYVSTFESVGSPWQIELDKVWLSVAVPLFSTSKCSYMSLGAFLMLINNYWPFFPVKKEMKTTVLAGLGLSVTAVLWLLLSCLNTFCAWDSYCDV